jgi:hypothetical protein
MTATTTARPRPAAAADDTPQALPAAPASERDLLAAVLQDPARMAEALGAGIDLSSYTDTYCRQLWPVLEQLYRRDGDLAPSVVADELRRRNLRTPEMESWLREALTGLAMRSVWTPGLERVREAQRRREIIIAAHRVRQAASAGWPASDIAPLATELAAAASPAAPDEPSESPAPREPFPVGALPPVMRRYVNEYARIMGIPPEYVALPMLATAAAAIGNSRTLRLRDTWHAPALIWACVVGPSGTGKSPPMEHALRPLRRHQSDAFRAYADAVATHRADTLRHERDVARWKKSSGEEEPPEEPTAPVCAQYVLDDTTLEAMAVVLAMNPRGVLLARDELGGWLEGMDAYRDAGDMQRWLSIHRAESFTVNRKTGDQRIIHIPRAAISIIGGIQPAILRRAMTRERVESGLMARILFAAPAAPPKKWTDADVSISTREAWARTVDGLLAIPMGVDADGEPEPVTLDMDAGARAQWRQWYDANARRTAESDGPVAAALAKIEEQAARLALVMMLARTPAAAIVDGEAMRAGITLATWFRAEAERLYGEDTDDRRQRELIELIRRRGGKITPRELAQASRRYQPVGVARAALSELVGAGHGRWDDSPPGPRGGRPAERFVIRPVYTSTVYGTPSNLKDSAGSVDVDTVDTPATDTDTPPQYDPADDVMADEPPPADAVPVAMDEDTAAVEEARQVESDLFAAVQDMEERL